MKSLFVALALLFSYSLFAQWGPTDTFAFANIRLNNPDGTPYEGDIELIGQKPGRHFTATLKKGFAKAKVPYDDMYKIICQGVENYKQIKIQKAPYVTHQFESYTMRHLVYTVEYISYEGKQLEGEEVIVKDNDTGEEYRQQTNEKGITKFYLPLEHSFTARVENLGTIRNIKVGERNQPRTLVATTLHWHGQEGYRAMLADKKRMQEIQDSLQKVAKEEALKERNRKQEELVAHINSLDIQKGTLKDPRDGQEYATIIVDGQEWMAENIAHELSFDRNLFVCGESEQDRAFRKTIASIAYDHNEKNIKKYGRLYTWTDAMRVCPEGWHLPTAKEWGLFLKKLGGMHYIGNAMRSKESWGDESQSTNQIGFNAIAAGEGNVVRGDDLTQVQFNGIFKGNKQGTTTSFWMNDKELKQARACYRFRLTVEMTNSEMIRYSSSYIFNLRSVRCVKNK